MSYAMYAREKFRNIKHSRLPAAYQEVEYIESTGTQYIDTECTFENSTKIEFTINKVDINAGQTAGTSRANVWFGNNGHPQTEMLLGWGSNGNNNYFRGATYSFDFYKLPINSKTNIVFGYKKGSGELFVNKVQQGNIAISTNTTTNETIVLGAVRDNLSPKFIYCKEQFHNSVRIYNNDTLVRDFVPCYRKSDGVIGMYDLVNDVFYTNQGTGTFLKGPNVNRKEKSKCTYSLTNTA